MSDEPRFSYSSAIFECQTVDAAKQIILTAGSIEEVEAHWREDTPVLAAQLRQHLKLESEHRVMDFGCGIGRLAKPLVEVPGCHVVGVDISASMRRMAVDYVGSSRFSVAAPDEIFPRRADDPGFDAAYALLVIQHCQDPEKELQRISDSLKPTRHFVLVNSTRRWLPTDKGWASDSIDVLQLASRILRREGMFQPPRASTPGGAEAHYGAVFTRR
ncbi:MAG: class I SAM-dependent methyltransferase [Proteobacteria bacterium]|nr:class I SAM-dependent methyltransferase [Pseudomonadota bacterium]